ncbi:MAG: hypothetical protein JWO64_3376 [Hyphomicrobiales bacterium]|jgi:hypothetical protein|nr:hypothetical protein [Hyphomicrobiales bacterium]
MNPRAFLATVALAGLLAGCSSPTVQATYVPYEKYAGLNCAQLTIALNRAQGRLDEASREPDTDAKADAVGALVAGYGKLRGEQTKVSAARGDIDAISVAQIRMRCKGF